VALLLSLPLHTSAILGRFHLHADLGGNALAKVATFRTPMDVKSRNEVLTATRRKRMMNFVN